VELLFEYIHDVVHPKLCKEETSAVPTDDAYSSDFTALLGKYGLRTISMSTVCHWMKSLGFKHEVQKKCYYVDGHKKPATIEYRKQFITRYLTYERRAHHWIQLNVDESIALENKGLVPKNSGYRYISENGDEMVEYHVNACKEFQEKMNKETNFGWKLSVRLQEQERPLLMFRHDEALFKQYLLTKKAWSGPNGKLYWYQKTMSMV
jgi:hypothetical protein